MSTHCQKSANAEVDRKLYDGRRRQYPQRMGTMEASMAAPPPDDNT